MIMTEEQKARWLEIGNAVAIKGVTMIGSKGYLSICATVAREAKREAMEELIGWIEVRRTDHAETPEPDLHDIGQVWAFQRVLLQLALRLTALEDET